MQKTQHRVHSVQRGCKSGCTQAGGLDENLAKRARDTGLETNNEAVETDNNVHVSFSMTSFSYFFFITLTSREICPDDSQPSGNALTIF